MRNSPIHGLNTPNEGGRAPIDPSDATLAAGRFPIVEDLRVELPAALERRIARVTREIVNATPRLSDVIPTSSLVQPGHAPGPTLVIEDHSSIQLFETRANQSYSYRGIWLAGPNDQIIVGSQRSTDFERYREKLLGFEPVEVLIPTSIRRTRSLAARALSDAALLERAAIRARAAGALTVLPYMGTGAVWTLAAAVAARAGVPVFVAAPPPGLTSRVNNKLWFAQCIAALIGRDAEPETRPAHGAAQLTAEVAQLARRYPSVVIKLPESASAKGNFALDSRDIVGTKLATLRDRLLYRMRAGGWKGGFPVLISAWERPVLVSPSAHLWIPTSLQGPPLLEGFFDQRLQGEADEFTGAVPSRLPNRWIQRLAYDSIAFARLFQELGYFGQCSFDAILVGDDLDSASLHWIECNGRWGGVSLPMMLANRLFGDWHRRPLVITQCAHLQGAPRRFRDALEAIRDDLYTVDGPERGTVLLSPSPLESGTGFEIMVVDEALDAAESRAAAVSARLRALLEVP